MRQKAESLKRRTQEKTDLFQENIRLKKEAVKTDVTEKKELLREKVDAKKAEVRVKLQENIAKRLRHFYARIHERLVKRLEHMMKIVTRVEEFSKQMAGVGKDTAEADGFIASAKDKLSQVRSIISGASDKASSIVADSDKDTAKGILEAIKETLHEAYALLKSAKDDIKLAIRSLKSLRGENNDIED